MILELYQITLIRGHKKLFERLSLCLKSGEPLTVRGANGSGKTSLLKLIAGLIQPSQGTVKFNNPAAPTQTLNYLGHKNALKQDLSPLENILYWHPSRKDKALSILELFGLSAHLHTPVKKLSQGQQRRIALTRTFLNSAPIWLLDEPAANLDAPGQAIVTTHLQKHLNGGGILILSEHTTPLLPHSPVLDLDALNTQRAA